jgi:hypothetical protein
MSTARRCITVLLSLLFSGCATPGFDERFLTSPNVKVRASYLEGMECWRPGPETEWEVAAFSTERRWNVHLIFHDAVGAPNNIEGTLVTSPPGDGKPHTRVCLLNEQADALGAP